MTLYMAFVIHNYKSKNYTNLIFFDFAVMAIVTVNQFIALSYYCGVKSGVIVGAIHTITITKAKVLCRNVGVRGSRRCLFYNQKSTDEHHSRIVGMATASAVLSEWGLRKNLAYQFIYLKMYK